MKTTPPPPSPSSANTDSIGDVDQLHNAIKSIMNQTSDEQNDNQQRIIDDNNNNGDHTRESMTINHLFRHRNRLKSYNKIHRHCFNCIKPLKCIRLPVSFNDAYQLSMEEKYSMILDVDYYCCDDTDKKQQQPKPKPLLNGYNFMDDQFDTTTTTNDEYCPVVRCTNNHCNMVMHYCKMNEHFLLCHYQMIPCINNYYGCPYTVLRGEMSKHLLDQCPANVVHCSAEWNRMPLYSSDKTISIQNFNSPHSLNIKNLDVALALRDQRMLKQLWSASRQMKRIMRGRLSTHPAVPIKPYIGIRTFREFRSQTTNVNNNNNKNQSSSTNSATNVLNDNSSIIIINNIEEEKYLNYATRLVEKAYKESLVEILRQTAQYYRRIYQESSHDYRQQQEQLRKKSNSICSQMLEHQSSSIIDDNSMTIDSMKTTATTNNQLLSPTLAIQQSYPSSSSINLPIITDSDKQYMQEMIRLKEEEKKAKIEANENNVNNKSSSTKNNRSKNNYTNDYYDKHNQPPIPPPVPKCNMLSLEISIRSYAFYQPKPRSMYTFRCGLDFRKNELASHSHDIHSDIHGGLDGWIEYRCPLFYNGCTFVHRRLWPRLTINEPFIQNNDKHRPEKTTTVVYNESLETFACCTIDNNNNIENEDDLSRQQQQQTKNSSFDDYDDNTDTDTDLSSYNNKQRQHRLSLDGKSNNRIIDSDDSINAILPSTSSSTYSLLYSNNFNHYNHNNYSSSSSTATIPLLLSSSSKSMIDGKGSQDDDDDDDDYDDVNLQSPNTMMKTKVPNVTIATAMINDQNRNNNNNHTLSLNNLPFELLQNICKYLDGFSLNNLSFTSKRMRMIVQTFVKKKGYVTLQWKRFEMEKGKYQWRIVYKKWQFSTAIQPIHGWNIDSNNVMAKHLQICPFYERNIRTEPFRICEFDPSSSIVLSKDNNDDEQRIKHRQQKRNGYSWNRHVASMK